MTDFVFNKPIRLIYTGSLIAPVAFRDKSGVQGLPRYNVQGLIPKDHPQLGDLNNLILALAREKFPQRIDPATGQWSAMGLGLPLKDGDVLAATAAAAVPPKDRPYYHGHMVLMAQKPEKSRAGTLLTPPHLRVLQGGKMVPYDDEQRALAKPFFYNGVLAAGSFQFKEYPGFGGGVTCYIDRVLSLNTGEHIQIGRDDEDVLGSADSYAEYVGHVTAESVMVALTGSPW